MKTSKLFTIGAFLIAVIALTSSCGGGKQQNAEATPEAAPKAAKVKPDNVEISGDLSDYIQIVDNEYEVTSEGYGTAKLAIKVKAIKQIPAKDMKNNEFTLSASLLGDNGMPASGTGEFTIKTEHSAGDHGSYDKLMSMLKKGSGEEVMQFVAEQADYRPTDVDKVKKFSVSSTMQEKENESASSSSSAGSDNSSSSSVDCDKFISDYEAFVNSYIKLLKKYKANPSDATILNEYTEAVQKAAEMQTNATNCNDPKYVTKLANLATKLAQAASDLK